VRLGLHPELRRIEPKPFDEMVAEFNEKHVRFKSDPGAFRVRTKVLLRYFGGRTLQEVTPKTIRAFIGQRLNEGVSEATVNRERACLSKIFNCAREWEYFAGENPVSLVKPFPEPPHRTRFLTADEATALLANSADHLRPICSTALHTGGRLREILSLTWPDVDLERCTVTFVHAPAEGRKTKGKKSRFVPIDLELMNLLRELKKVRQISGDRHLFTWHGKEISRVSTSFETARVAAKLGDNVSFHTLRHTFASWYMINGGDLYQLKEYLGHSTIALTQRYAHLSAEHQAAGVRFFGPPRAIEAEEGKA